MASRCRRSGDPADATLAAVGHHGREVCTRLLLGVVLTSAALAAQSPERFQDLLPDLAAKIAVALGGAPASLLSASPDVADARAIETSAAALLGARGVRIVPRADDVAAVRLVCLENLRERVCSAEVRRGPAPVEVVVATRPLLRDGAAERRAAPSLEWQPLFSQRTAILDLVRLEGHLLVLDATAVALYEQTDRGWELQRSRALPVSRAWPRDLRGRLQVRDDRVEAFLPGMTCTDRVNGTMLTCTQGAQAWPLGIDNAGLGAGANTFTTPDGRAFVAAAPLGPDADARWLVADRDGALTWLDATRRRIASTGRGDDVARLGDCGSETRVLVASRGEGRDSLRVFHVGRGRLEPITPVVPVSGTLTALWPVPGTPSAIAVVHDAAAGRHDAFLASLPCAR